MKSVCLMAILPREQQEVYTQLVDRVKGLYPGLQPAKGPPHLTLLYFGELEPKTVSTLCDAARAICAVTTPVEMMGFHVTTFPAGDNGIPVILEYKLTPELEAFYQTLEEQIGDYRDPTVFRHPRYRPHTTLGYIPVEAGKIVESFHDILPLLRSPVVFEGQTPAPPLLAWTLRYVQLRTDLHKGLVFPLGEGSVGVEERRADVDSTGAGAELEALRVRLKAQYHLTKLWVSKRRDLDGINVMSLDSIEVDPAHRKQGLGGKALAALLVWADAHQYIVLLDVAKDSKPSQGRLIQWYKKHGFRLNKGAKKDFRFRHMMIRQPAIASVQAETRTAKGSPCAPASFSWAWIDPHGEVHKLGDKTKGYDHRDFAYHECARRGLPVDDNDYGKQPLHLLQKLGWIAANNVFSVSFWHNKPSKAAWDTVFREILACVAGKRDNGWVVGPEQSDVLTIQEHEGKGYRRMSIADAIAEYGDRHWEAKLFELFAARTGAADTITEADLTALAATLKAKHHLADLTLVLLPGNAFEVKSIIVASGSARQGMATRAMQEVVAFADAHQCTAVLTPGYWGQKRPNKAELTRWYSQFGFVPNKGPDRDSRFNNTMIRRPQDNQRVAQADLSRGRYEHAQTERFTPPQFPDPRRDLLGEAPCPRGGPPYMVWAIDGKTIRDHVDIDFTMGGNPARYGYMPLDEIWIEKIDGPPKDWACTLLHELVEDHLMWGGQSYDDAHEVASSIEQKLRDFDFELQGTEQVLPLALQAFARWKETQGTVTAAGYRHDTGGYGQFDTSWAWITPQGEILVCTEHSHEMAAQDILRDQGEEFDEFDWNRGTATKMLLRQGWVRAANKVAYQMNGPCSDAALKAVVDSVADFAGHMRRTVNIEERDIVKVDRGPRSHYYSIADFVEEFGTPAQQAELYKVLGIMGRTAPDWHMGDARMAFNPFQPADVQPDGEEAPHGAKHQRNSDPFPPEFREQMKAKGKVFTNPETQNKVLFGSLPWKEQLRLFEDWLKQHDKGRNHQERKDKRDEREHELQLRKNDRAHESHQERKHEAEPEEDAPAAPGGTPSHTVKPQDHPNQQTPDGEPAATGNNLHPDTRKTFSDMAEGLKMGEEAKHAVQNEIFKQPAAAVDKHAATFRENKEKYGFAGAALSFLLDLGIHALEHVKKNVQDLFGAVHRDVQKMKAERDQLKGEVSAVFRDHFKYKLALLDRVRGIQRTPDPKAPEPHELDERSKKAFDELGKRFKRDTTEFVSQLPKALLSARTLTGGYYGGPDRETRARTLAGPEGDDDRMPGVLDVYPREMAKWQGLKRKKHVMVYRAIGSEDPNTTILPGDWVALDRKYAAQMLQSDGDRMLSAKVPLDHLVWAGTDIEEWFYVPRSRTARLLTEEFLRETFRATYGDRDPREVWRELQEKQATAASISGWKMQYDDDGHSWAWIEPHGRLHEVWDPGHEYWARDYVAQHNLDPDNTRGIGMRWASTLLLEQGWVRAANAFAYQIGDRGTKDGALAAMVEGVIECAYWQRRTLDLEKDKVVHLDAGPSTRSYTVAAFVRRCGTRAQENALFERVLARTASDAVEDWDRSSRSVGEWEYIVRGEWPEGKKLAESWMVKVSGQDDAPLREGTHFKQADTGDGLQAVLIGGAFNDLDHFISQHAADLFYRMYDNGEGHGDIRRLDQHLTAGAHTRDSQPNWRGHMTRPSPEAVRKLQDMLTNMHGHPGIHDPQKQFETDPDLEEILAKGKVHPIRGRIKKLGENSECHWNVVKLFEGGDIDEIAIGYAYTDADGWHQHTWGRKGGRIVETTSGNAAASKYFGLSLRGSEAQAFAQWVNDHPPGGGMVRRISSALRTPTAADKRLYNIHGWHTTLADNWDSIRIRGLVPGAAAPSGQDWKGVWSGKGTYLHQQLPVHELENAAADADVTLIVLEVRLHGVPPSFVAADEDAGSPDETPTVLQQGGAIAVGLVIKPREIVAVHLPDTAAYRAWADTHARGHKVAFYHGGQRTGAADSAAFWDALKRQAGSNQVVFMSPFVAIGDKRGGILATLEMRAHAASSEVRLGFIGVAPEDRGKKYATRVMKMITAAADAAGYSITLTVSPQLMADDEEAPMGKAALKAFYRKFGFQSAGGDDMIRKATRTASADPRLMPFDTWHVGRMVAEPEASLSNMPQDRDVFVMRIPYPGGRGRNMFVLWYSPGRRHLRLTEDMLRTNVTLTGPATPADVARVQQEYTEVVTKAGGRSRFAATPRDILLDEQVPVHKWGKLLAQAEQAQGRGATIEILRARFAAHGDFAVPSAASGPARPLDALSQRW